MNSTEYANLAQIEGQHWYYSGKRELVRRWLCRVRRPNKQHVLLDCGAGTGRFAHEMEELCQVYVLDDHEEALGMLRDRFRAEQILTLVEDRIPLPDQSLDYITALDVLEHVADDSSVVRGFHRVLKSGGIVAITVPAGMALWSDWDVALHHFRRYRRRELRRLFPAESWDVLYVNYTNVLVYPVVWCLRRWRAWFPASSTTVRAEDRVPPGWLNGLLQWAFVSLARCRLPFPFGVSLLLVATRR